MYSSGTLLKNFPALKENELVFVCIVFPGPTQHNKEVRLFTAPRPPLQKKKDKFNCRE